MRKYAETNRVLFTKGTPHGWDIVMVRSESNPDKKYTVDMTHGRCSCPAWIHQSGGGRKICKHLRKLGFKELIEASATNVNVNIAEPAKVGGQKVKVKA